MARHGENIRKRNDGRWEARYPIYDTKQSRKIYRSVYGSTYEEAKRKRADTIQIAGKISETERIAIQEDSNCSDMKLPFAQIAGEWLDMMSKKCKYSTYVKYETIYRLHLKGIFEACLLSDGRKPEFQKKIFDNLSDRGSSESIRKSVCCIANQILGFANRKYSLCIPALKPAFTKPAKKPVETLSKSEQYRLFTHIYSTLDRFKIAMLLCLYTGMRLGELCALKWTDFDFEDGTVTINRTVQRIAVKGYPTKTMLLETEPKSESSKRAIPLTEEIKKLLEKFKGNHPYVFGGKGPLEPRSMQYQFKKNLREAAVDERNFHILRHTFATNCVESGMDVKTLSVILGHSDVKITLNRYVHPTMDSKRRQIGRLPDFYGQICGQVA